MRNRLQAVRWAMAGVCMTAATAQALPTLLVDGSGDLIGASRVDVGGAFYDVAFVDGACFGVFGLCNGPESFTFTTEATATVATNALMNQVFRDDPLGSFDTDPGTTTGIAAGTTYGAIVTPYSVAGRVNIVFFQNAIGEAEDVVITSYLPSTLTNLAGVTGDVFAVWSPSAPVPEPAESALLAVGLGVLVAAVRGRRKMGGSGSR